MKIIGVYKLQSKIKPERIYIGSSIDVKNRISGHFTNMLMGYSSLRLVSHFIEFGRDDFEVTILEECPVELRRTREQYYIDLYKPYFNYLNIDGSVIHGKRWDSTTQEEDRERFEKLLEIRKRLHKEHLAKYNIG